MNDKFAAQLRQHLVNEANERPAEGQLATLVERVAGTAQRRPFVARLTAAPGRIGRMPSAAVRLGFIAIALVLVTGVMGVVIGGAPHPSPSPATDPTSVAIATPTAAPTATSPALEPTVAPSAEPNTPCIEFSSEGPYLANVGTLPVAVTVPATASELWSGDRRSFFLRKASCDAHDMPLFTAALVAHVYADACHWKGSEVDAPTAFDVVAELAKQTGHDTVGPIETHIGAFRATRFDFSLPQGFDVGNVPLHGSLQRSQALWRHDHLPRHDRAGLRGRGRWHDPRRLGQLRPRGVAAVGRGPDRPDPRDASGGHLGRVVARRLAAHATPGTPSGRILPNGA